MKPATASSTIEILTAIWQRLLQNSEVAPQDNFFDLGGDSSLAVELFNEITRAFGRELPAVMIYYAPTIVALGRVLDEDAAPKARALVELKSGSERPPIFLTHGLGGSVMDFYQVVKHLELPQPIYGMQAKGIDGAEEPFDRIEDLAAYFIDAIRQIQPSGPYVLIGFSLGGLVTLEMAQQLILRGENTALLALLDSYPHVRYLSRVQRARFGTRQAVRRIWRSIDSARNSTGDSSMSALQKRLRESAYSSLRKYQPLFYPGKVSFVRAAIPTDFPADAAGIWGPLVRELEVTTVPGDHLGMMTTHFQSLAAAISELVKRTIPIYPPER